MGPCRSRVVAAGADGSEELFVRRLRAFSIVADIFEISSKFTAFVFLTHPRSVGRRSFSVITLASSKKPFIALGCDCGWLTKIGVLRARTDKVHDLGSLDGRGCQIAKDDDRSGHLPQAKGLCLLSEGVCGVECFGNELAHQFAIGEHVRIESLFGPEQLCCVENRLVEDVVVSEEGIFTAE